MRRKNIFSVLMVILMTFALSSLAAQENESIGVPELKIITGIGFDLSSPLLTTAGEDLLTSQLPHYLLILEPISFLIGGRVPFLMAFEIAKPYSLGFGAYLSGAYHHLGANSELSIDGKSIGDVQFNYRRFVFSLSPVFYGELALSEMFALSLAIGPTLALSLGDKQTVTGTAKVTEGKSFVRKNAAQLLFGMLLDLGFQVKFTKMIGMGVDAYTQIYFSGQKVAQDENTWWKDGEQIYQGSVGASVSFLLFL